MSLSNRSPFATSRVGSATSEPAWDDLTSTTVVPATLPPGPNSLVGRFNAGLHDRGLGRTDDLDALKPSVQWFGDYMASGKGKQDRDTGFLELAAKGKSYDEQRRDALFRDAASTRGFQHYFEPAPASNPYRLQFGGAALPSPVFAASPSDPYDVVRGIMKQIHDLGLTPIGLEGRPGLAAPNLAQLGVAGLAALFNPHLAKVALATPFQAQLGKNDLDAQAAQERNANRVAERNAKLQGLHNDLGFAEWNAAHPVPAAKPAKADWARLSLPQQVAAARSLEANPDFAQALATYLQTPASERPGLADQYAGRGMAAFESFSDEALTQLGNLKPEDRRWLAAGRDLSAPRPSYVASPETIDDGAGAKGPREGAMQGYLQPGQQDFKAARNASVEAAGVVRKVRKELPIGLGGMEDSDRRERNAYETRNRANEGGASLQSQNPYALDEFGRRLDSAYSATQATLKDLDTQRAAILNQYKFNVAKRRSFSQDGSADAAGEANEAQIRSLKEAYDALMAQVDERQGYLARLDAQRRGVTTARDKAIAFSRDPKRFVTVTNPKTGKPERRTVAQILADAKEQATLHPRQKAAIDARLRSLGVWSS